MSSVVLATAGFDHKIRFWEASKEKCTRVIKYPDSQINALAITADKHYIAAAGNPHAKIFEVATQNSNPVRSYDAHQGNVTAVGFQCDSKWMFTGSEDKTVKIWDLRAPRAQRVYECKAGVNSVVLHPNQTELISGDQNGNVRVWDLQANACMQEIVPDTDREASIQSVAVANDASLVVAASNRGRVFCWNPLSSKEYQPRCILDTQHSGYLLKCIFSPDVSRLVTCSSDKTVRVWQSPGAATVSDPAPAPAEDPSSMDPDAHGADQFILEKSLEKHQRWVWDACFSADSAYLVTASSDYTARLWDVHTGDVIRNYQSQMAVTCVALNDAST
mmetsp:Transcript_6264/g.18293  ORF Transcript_6264/g.18293 Transcript_6264/m.18293 type:complete len:332 (-) Transcript_6264:32-1027(-)|eukprot:CAMPEP_0118964328 /NCGR_PEP_ID=MMETSP1173-20130426/2046_1 /TAXON_ID=1034831 /ORGANISM="Rhizochromulina marina cf, Strain CCMP1243" /LENGTH=331 /DNA_ID=CAMNT_0006912773 /DNA_START=14 /DNA_END=1009 /DNA_ORIENTATION=-